MASAYRHVQPFTVLWAVVPSSALLITALALRHGHDGVIGVLALNWALCAAALALLGRLTIEVRGDALHWTFGYLGWPHWQVGLHEIARTEIGRPSVWRGAGIRGLGNDRLYNAAMGGPALRLTLRNGRRITLGTPEPERLEHALRAWQATP